MIGRVVAAVVLALSTAAPADAATVTGRVFENDDLEAGRVVQRIARDCERVHRTTLTARALPVVTRRATTATVICRSTASCDVTASARTATRSLGRRTLHLTRGRTGRLRFAAAGRARHVTFDIVVVAGDRPECLRTETLRWDVATR